VRRACRDVNDPGGDSGTGERLNEYSVPPTPAVLDLLEFMCRHSSEPSNANYHSFFKHHHLRFDRGKGRAAFRESANRLLARGGLAYELDSDGRVRRRLPRVIAARLASELPSTVDQTFDELVRAAVERYLDPDPSLRRDGLEKLWDAFERIKTILDENKKTGAELLLANATGGATEEAELLRTEMRALTDIGNQFRIRHHETRATDLTPPLIDYLFTRMYALLLRLDPTIRPKTSATAISNVPF
jgi:hypothetical protein